MEAKVSKKSSKKTLALNKSSNSVRSTDSHSSIEYDFLKLELAFLFFSFLAPLPLMTYTAVAEVIVPWLSKKYDVLFSFESDENSYFQDTYLIDERAWLFSFQSASNPRLFE